MTFQINVGGAWKDAAPKINVGGTWKDPAEVWANVGGTWKKVYEAEAGGTFDYVSGSYSTDGDPASFSINCTQPAVWTWSKVSGAIGQVSVASGSSSTNITFQVTGTQYASRVATFNVTGTSGSNSITLTITLTGFAIGNGGGTN